MKQGDAEEIWTVDGDTAICELDEHHTLFVSREPDGVRLRVKDYTDRPDKPRTIFLHFFGDLQLGHVFRRQKK
jgi:hypothetical protein